MFHSKKTQVDFKRATQKFLDAKKDSRARAHALRILLDNFETHEAKVFFQRHYSEIYYICHDYFSIVEVNLRQKANKSVREDLDGVLYIFEKILLLLPELVHDRWQFGSIGRTMQKLLHRGNAFKLRSEGIRLLILWLQSLQNNMNISCEVMFACVVPGFPNPLDILDTSNIEVPLHVLEEICSTVRGPEKDVSHASGSMTLLPQENKNLGSRNWCTRDELQVLVPLINQNQTEKIPGLEDLTKVYINRVLDYMITQIGKIEWLDKSMRKRGFECLFNLFKKYYLHHVFPMWTPVTNLYATDSEKQVQEIRENSVSTPNDLHKYADSVVKWFVAFTSKIKRVAKMQYGGELLVSRSTSQSTDSLNNGANETQAATTEQSRKGAIYEDLIVSGKVIRDVIYSTRENVQILHEVFRQGFLLPMDKSVIIREVLAVYYNWLKSDNRPKFMLEPSVDGAGSAINGIEDVRAGLQGSVRLFIFHSSLVFLTPSLTKSLSNQILFEVRNHLKNNARRVVYCYVRLNQVDICKRVIQIYRNIVLETPMHGKTWEQLLVVLLAIAEHVLKDKAVEPKLSSFAGKLAPVLLQTLFVTWIRANLSVTVSVELWDRFLDVASSLTHWNEVVFQWKQTMDTLTSVIARRVYGLNLNDLPLDRLSEQKHKKRRHQFQAKDNSIDNTKSKILPTSSVQESKQEVAPSAAAPIVVPPQEKDVEEMKNEGSAPATGESQECKSSSDLPKEPIQYDQTSTTMEGDRNSQITIEQESERGYESDVTDTGSDLSFETAPKSMQGDTDMSLNSLLSTYGGSAPKDLDGDKNSTTTANEDTESIDDSSSRSTIENGKNQNTDFTEVDGKRKRARKGVKPFWKDSDGAEEISSDSEVPSSFSNPIHDETAFESVIPITTPLDAQTVSLEIGEPSVHSLEIETEVSVVCGGTKEGWSPVAAVVLWCRMLGVLGNINDIESAAIHAQVLESLSQIWCLLEKIRLNQGISEDNKSTPSVPQLLPPLHYFSSWLFQATNLPQKYKHGRLIAYQLLCSMTVRRQDNPLSEDYLRHFYRCLHDGLTGTDQDIINAIMSKCDKFFAMVLPSSSLLIPDFIYAANTIIESTNTEYPRTEAVTVLASLLCYPIAFPNMNIYQIGSSPLGEQVTACRDLKDKISEALYKVARTDPDCHARCTALSAIGIFIVEDLTHQGGDCGRLLQYTSLLLTSIMFKNWSVSNVAIGIIRNLSEYYEQLSNCDADLPLRILQVLCEIIMRCVSEGALTDTSHGVKVLNPLLSCLLDWVMVIPLSALMRVRHENQSTLSQVFQSLKFVVSNKSTTAAREFNITRMISHEDLPIHLGQIHQDFVDSTPTSPADITDSEYGDNILSETMNRVKKTAKAVILHIVNHLNHFPLSSGAARLTSIVTENQDNVYCSEQQELTPAIFSSPNVQFFILNDTSLISLVELPLKQNDSTNHQTILCGSTATRLIVRDMCGKHCLDISTLFGPSVNNGNIFSGVLKCLFDDEELREIFKPRHDSSFCRKSAETSHQSDKLDELLKDIGSTSPECLFYPHLSLNEPAPTPLPLNEQFENKLMKAIEMQREREEEYCQNTLQDQRLKGSPINPNVFQKPNNPFHLSHFLFNQLGMFGWEKRPKIDLLKKSDKLVRELKHLDNRKSRETHKIAVFYVAPGQEDKTSIMSNTSGSKEYENFVAGLAWEVELSTHSGFMGGLDKNQSTGNTAAYFANSTVEIMFHVATRMPVSTDEGGFIKKVRHLGNDEIWIVWSEHSRDFRHGIVNAEFGDVVIAVYPLKNHLFRVQILKKGEIPYFGPLFDGAVVDRRVLPPLVRMTAVNASRAKRSLIPGMQTYYEERASCISNIVNQHKETTVFEDFAEEVFCPLPRKPEENTQPFSLSSHFRQASVGDEPSVTKRDGYSTLPSTRIARSVAEKDPISSTMSLPDGLHKVSQSETLTQKMDKKRMSLRRKLAQTAKEDTME